MGLLMIDVVKPKFFISIAGVNPNIFSYNYLPSYHFIGKNDPIKNKSIKLLNMFDNPHVKFFDGKHQFPSNKCKEDL